MTNIASITCLLHLKDPYSLNLRQFTKAYDDAFEAKQKSEGMKLFARLESMPTKESKSHYFFLTICYRDPTNANCFKKLTAN